MNKKLLINNTADNEVILQVHFTDLTWPISEYVLNEDMDDEDDTYEYHSTSEQQIDDNDYNVVSVSDNFAVNTIYFSTETSVKNPGLTRTNFAISIYDAMSRFEPPDKQVYVKDYKIDLVVGDIEVTFTSEDVLAFNGFFSWTDKPLYAVNIWLPIFIDKCSDLQLKITLIGVSDTPVVTVPAVIGTDLVSGGTTSEFAVPYGFSLYAIDSELSKWDYTDVNFTTAGSWKAITSSGADVTYITEPVTLYPRHKYKAAPEHGSFTITITPGTYTRDYSSFVDRYWGYTFNTVTIGANPGPPLGSAIISGAFTNADLDTNAFYNDSKLVTETTIYTPPRWSSGISVYGELNFNVYWRYDDIHVTMTPYLADTKGYVTPEPLDGYFRKNSKIYFYGSTHYTDESFTDSSHIPLTATTFTATW